jgi:hypothetical protein
MKTFTLFLLPVIYVRCYGLKTKKFFFFPRLSKYCLKPCLLFVLFLCHWAAGTINLFSMCVFITDFLCFAYNTSTFVPTECCFTGIKFIGITENSIVLIVYVSITGLLVCGIWTV